MAAMLLIGVFAWHAWHVDHWNLQQVIFYGSAALICIAVQILALLSLFTNLNFIRLDADGFNVQFPWKLQRRCWKDVNGFNACWRGKGRVVAFTDETGRNTFLNYTYGFTKDEFARLMAEWRQRALAMPS